MQELKYYNLKHLFNFKQVSEISVEEGTTTSANAKRTTASSPVSLFYLTKP